MALYKKKKRKKLFDNLPFLEYSFNFLKAMIKIFK